MTLSSATYAHEHAVSCPPTNAIEVEAITADATGIARVRVARHELLVEGGGNFDLAPSSAEILMGALAADVLQEALAVADRRGVAIVEARVDAITHFFAGLLGGVESDDPIGPHDFAAKITFVAPEAEEADLSAIRREAGKASSIAGLLRTGSLLNLNVEAEQWTASGLPRHILDRAAGLEALRNHVRDTPQAAEPAYWRRPLTASAFSSRMSGISRLVIRNRFNALADTRSVLAPSPVEITVASLATCLTHTAIMHAALDGRSFDSATASLRFEHASVETQAVIAGELSIGMSDGDVAAGEGNGAEALAHCLLVHCFGRVNSVTID